MAAAVPGGPLGTQTIIRVSTRPTKPNRRYVETQNQGGGSASNFLYFDTTSTIHAGDDITGPINFSTTNDDDDGTGVFYHEITSIVAVVCPHP
jgi:hypothetical protein